MRPIVFIELAVGIALMFPGALSPNSVAAPMNVREALKQSDAWFLSDEGRIVLDNVLSHQSAHGDWAKNQNSAAARFTGDPQSIKGTFDNGATTDELRLLARAIVATNDVRYRSAFLKGFDHILAAQYTNGGWPQYSPPAKSYHRHITFNDGSMMRLMEFLRAAATLTNFDFVPAEKRKAASLAFDRGVDCILKCQVRVGGSLTVWCAQHDEKDYSPRTGRAYELPSLSGSESVGITRLLMSLDSPSADVVRAVEGAVAWFQSAKLTGIRIETKPDAQAPKGVNKIVVRDPSAPPLWARFYDLESNKPIFVDRDGFPKASLADISYERRNGYAWYGSWPESLLEMEYPAWKKKWNNAGKP